MEEQKIRDLFSDFQPELSSSTRFMSKLQKNMEMVEILKTQNAVIKKHNRLAVAIAAACGFVMGVIMTLLFPIIEKFVSSFSVMMPEMGTYIPAINLSFLSWIIIAAVCIVTTLNAYEIASAKLIPKENL